jgi:hypothetical protein
VVTRSTRQTASDVGDTSVTSGPPVTTDVAPGPLAITDRVVAAFLRNLGKEGAPVSEVHVSFDGPYLIYTVVESKSSAALDKVYRAEAETQREFWGPGLCDRAVVVFEHRNRSLGGRELEDDFLSRGRFSRVL